LNSKLLLIILLVFAPLSVSQGQYRRSDLGLKKATVEIEKSTNIGNIGLTVSNFGTIGDGFVTQNPEDLPSAEYPLGSGIEHMFSGGLWVGARTSDGQVLVTTGAVDVPSISSRITAGFEYTNTADPDDKLLERSTIIDSPFFSEMAISHQDFVAEFSDTNTKIPNPSEPDPLKWETIASHIPLGIAIQLETYAWNFPFADAFVILNYSIKNVRKDNTPLRDVYVGIWADLVVRNTTITSPRVGGPFYQHVANGYIDTLQMAYAYDFDGDPGFTDDGLYGSLKLLGATADPTDDVYRFRAIYNTWLFRNNSDPLFFSPTTDGERYEKMSIDSLFIQDNILPAIGLGPGNFMTYIGLGPFKHILPDEDRNQNGVLDPGEDGVWEEQMDGSFKFIPGGGNNELDDHSINVVFAFVAAAKAGADDRKKDTLASKQHLITNGGWAKRAYNGEDKNENNILDEGEDIINPGVLDRYLLPTPPLPPKVKVIPGDGQAELYWSRRSENSIDLLSGEKDFEGYRVYKTQIASDRPGSSLLSTFTNILQIDKIDSIGYDTGLDVVRLSSPVTFAGDTTQYHYKLTETNLNNGWQYAYSVTAFDKGDAENNLGSFESGKRATTVRFFPGAKPVTSLNEDNSVGVYPNPYKAKASWDGFLERERKIYFFNLPAESEVRIYSLTGDLIDTFEHNAVTYSGDDIQWFETFSDGSQQFSGGEHAWNLVSKDDQAIASGLYIYVVKNRANGDIQRGKFLVIK